MQAAKFVSAHTCYTVPPNVHFFLYLATMRWWRPVMAGDGWRPVMAVEARLGSGW